MLTFKIHYREHDATRVRVWQDGWSFDQFDVITKEELEVLRNVWGTVKFVLVDHDLLDAIED